MKLTTTTALAVAAASLASAHAQQHGGADWFSLIQREFERSSELLEQMWDATIGRVEEMEEMPSNNVQVVVVEVESDEETPLTADEKMLACRVAVKRIAEQATLRQATEQLEKRLRSDVVSVHYMDETTCDVLESPQLVAECVRVTDFASEIEVFLRHGKTDIEICDAVRAADELEEEQDPTPLSCKLCKRFVQMVVQAIAQDVQQVQIVRDILGDICDSMAADSMCHTFLKNFDNIVDWLKHGTDPNVVCTKITMCTAQQEADLDAVMRPVVKETAPVLDDSHACFYCSQISSVVGFVSKHAPDQLDTVRTVLKYVCKITPEDCKCDDAEKNFDKIVDLTKQGKSPKEVCTAIGMCKSYIRSDESKMVALVSTPSAARKITTALLSFTTPDGVLDDKKCFYCDYFTTLLEIAIQEDEKDLDEVRQYADIICGMFGDSNMCHQYVDKLDYVVDALKSGKKPREICTALKFCAAKTPTPAIASAESQLTLASRAVGAIDNCFFCTQLASIFKVALAQDESQIDQIRTVADLICHALPADNKCHQVMKQVDQVLDALKKGEEPEAICQDLKFCKKAAHNSIARYGDNKCVYCEVATMAVEFAVQQDAQDFDAIRMYADIVCGMLGESSSCHAYVDKLDFVLDSIKSGKTPREICAALKFCTAKHKAIAPPEEKSKAVVMPTLSKAITVDNCFFCTQLTALFKVALAQDEQEISQIRTIADLVCKALPKDNQCHLVMKEVDQIIDSLKKGEEPAAICHDLKFCPTSSPLEILFAKPVKANGDHDCAYCEGAATVLEYAIKAKPDQVQQVREAAGIVCDFMPADDKCHDDLKIFDKAVAEIKAGKSPHDICTELNFCKTSKLSPKAATRLDALDAAAIASKAGAKSMSVGCLLCEYTAEVVTHIHDNQSELRLAKKTLGTMCFVLPPTARCDTISAKFDDIVQLVGTDKKSPSEACHAIKMCDAALVEPRPISDVVAEERH